VPAFFNQAERQAILDGVELAGLKSLALLEDGSAGEPSDHEDLGICRNLKLTCHPTNQQSPSITQ
jgi:hypothetical protein